MERTARRCLWCFCFWLLAAVAAAAAVDFHKACAEGQLDNVRQAIADGTDVKASDDRYGAAPVFIAASFGQLEVVKLLGEHGVDVFGSEHQGITPLHLASQRGHISLVKHLTGLGQDAEQPTETGNTPLHLAAANGHLRVAKYLLRELDVDPEATNAQGETPLFAAAAAGRMSMATFLVEEFEVEVDAFRLDGSSPLIQAAANKHRKIVKFLFSHGADISHADLLGVTALHAATQTGDEVMMGFLQQATLAAEAGLSYEEFVKQTEQSRQSAQGDAYSLRSALKSEPNNALLQYKFAEAVAKMGRNGEALQHLKEALRLEPDNPEFAQTAHRLVSHIETESSINAQQLWQHLLKAKGTRVDGDDPIDASTFSLFERALGLRDDWLLDEDDSSKQQADDMMRQVAHKIQQFMGVGLSVRDGWLEDEGFPLTSTPLYGQHSTTDPGASCSCDKTAPRVQRDPDCHMTVLVDTWRFVAHSYAVAGEQLVVALLGVPGLCAFITNPPYADASWRPISTKRSVRDDILARTPLWNASDPTQACPDVVLRVSWPMDVEPFPCPGTKTIVFGATELRRANPVHILKELRHWNETEGVTIITPSQWSAQGFLHDGTDAELIRVVPFGVDKSEFSLDQVAASAKALRASKGWTDKTFVFLHVDAANMHSTSELIQAFAAVHAWFEKTDDRAGFDAVKLVLAPGESSQGQAPSASTDFDSLAVIGLDGEFLDEVNVRELFDLGAIELVAPAEVLTSRERAALYGAADVYVSPYHAEAYDLPVLEAAAVGTPVVVTKGGPTDDFTTKDFALWIDSKPITHKDKNHPERTAFSLQPDPKDIVRKFKSAIRKSKWRASAGAAAAEYVANKLTLQHITRRIMSVIMENGGPPGFAPPPGAGMPGANGKGRAPRRKPAPAKAPKLEEVDMDEYLEL